ncbi:hypothetical protein [Photobacterium leiognathi]|uniref:hypothetical protein n=1 Tax=Photobacterium leiognathi TaxID=553611 RepID=UPI002982AAEB|nr:hypothetical protein [Photobacterium leiognathi]
MQQLKVKTIAYEAVQRKLGHEPKNSLWSSPQFFRGFTLALNNGNKMSADDVIKAINNPLFEYVIKLIENDVRLKLRMFSAAEIAALLTSVLRDGKNALGFWHGYIQKKGRCVNNVCNAVLVASLYYSWALNIKYEEQDIWCQDTTQRTIFYSLLHCYNEHTNNRYLAIKDSNDNYVFEQLPTINVYAFLGHECVNQYLAHKVKAA